MYVYICTYFSYTFKYYYVLLNTCPYFYNFYVLLHMFTFTFIYMHLNTFIYFEPFPNL